MDTLAKTPSMWKDADPTAYSAERDTAHAGIQRWSHAHGRRADASASHPEHIAKLAALWRRYQVHSHSIENGVRLQSTLADASALMRVGARAEAPISTSTIIAPVFISVVPMVDGRRVGVPQYSKCRQYQVSKPRGKSPWRVGRFQIHLTVEMTVRIGIRGS